MIRLIGWLGSMTGTASHGHTSQTSQTITATSSPREGSQSPIVLRLEAEDSSARTQRVTWAPETIDNEDMGKKKSNGSFRYLCWGFLFLVCCIFHASNKEQNGDDGMVGDWNAYENQPKRCSKPT